MTRTTGSWLLLACTVGLGACNTGVPDSGSLAFSDDTSNAQQSQGKLDDIENAHAVLNNDGLQAPPAPTLSIDGRPGSLTFSWRTQSEDQVQVQQASLYGIDRRNGSETLISSELNLHTKRFELPIVSHKLAWNHMQYRVELCSSSTQCVSSNYMPIASLFAKSIVTVQANNPGANDQYAYATAINAQGNIIAALAPKQNSLFIHFELPNGWVQGSESMLFSGELSALQVNTMSSVSMSFSASGDTLAVAGVSKSTGAVVAVFDRFGENWIQTAQFKPWDLSQQALDSATWPSNAVKVQLADDGEQLLISLQATNNDNEEHALELSQLAAMTRSGATWEIASSIPLTQNSKRLPAFSASANLKTVFLLSEYFGDTLLSVYKYINDQWQLTTTAPQPMLLATSDAQVHASANGDSVLVGGWENSIVLKTPVLWRFTVRNDTVELLDSIREPTTDEPLAQYRLASDENLEHVALGWQSEDDAELSVYSDQQQAWVNSFSMPDNLNISAKAALAQSVLFSNDGSTLLVSSTQPLASPNPGTGGFMRIFK